MQARRKPTRNLLSSVTKTSGRLDHERPKQKTIRATLSCILFNFTLLGFTGRFSHSAIAVDKAKEKTTGSQEQQAQPRVDEVPTNSWYPPSVLNSPSTSRPGTPSSSTSSNNFNLQRLADRGQSPSHVSPSEAASVISLLKDKSVEELHKLLSDKDAYQHFLQSVDQVKIQNNLKQELRKETLQLTRQNLEKEPVINELRNQCRIIRTSELAAAEEKLNELERQKKEILKLCSSASLLQRLEEATKKTDEESEALHSQLIAGEIDMATFVQKYKKNRNIYHKRSLIHLAAKTSLTG